MNRSFITRFALTLLVTVFLIVLAGTPQLESQIQAQSPTPSLTQIAIFGSPSGGGFISFPSDQICGIFHLFPLDANGNPLDFTMTPLPPGTYTFRFVTSTNFPDTDTVRLELNLMSGSQTTTLVTILGQSSTTTLGGTAFTVSDFTYVANGTDKVSTCNRTADNLGDYTGQFTLTVTSCTPSPSSLISWFPLDGNTNEIVAGNNGTAFNGPTSVAGIVDRALSFDSVDDYVLAPAGTAPTGSAPRTVELWINVAPGSTAGDQNTLFFYGMAGPLGQSFGIDPDGLSPSGTVLLQVFTFGEDLNGIDTGVPPGKFFHFAVTVDPSRVMRAYVNGIEKAVRTLPSLNTVPTEVNIGRVPAGGPLSAAHFGGILDEVTIYNRALSQAELQAIVNAGSAGKCKTFFTCTPAPAGVVSWYPAEGNANDTSGNNNNATLGAGVTFSSGQVGLGFDFPATHGGVTAPDAPSLALTQQISMEAWVNPRTLPASAGSRIIDKITAGAGNGYLLDIIRLADGSVRYRAITINGAGSDLISNQVAQTNVFTHVAATYDGTMLKLYINGLLDSSKPVTGPIPTNNNPLRIGIASNGGELFNGLIDEATIYNRALTAAEIQAIVQASSGGKCAVVNRTPTANNDSYTINEDTTLTVAAPGLLGNDTDPDNNPLTAIRASNPTNGTLQLNANGSFTYTPAVDFNGTDSFTYVANDGFNNSNLATVTITINPVDDPIPTISIDDAAVVEGDSGARTAIFLVNLSVATTKPVTVNFATTVGTATTAAGAVPADYIANMGTLTFPVGSTQQTVSVQVNGDLFTEADENFTVTLSNPANGTLGRSMAVGTITNDDAAPAISINDTQVAEGNAGTTNATFSLSLTNPSSQTVTVDFFTMDGSASSTMIAGASDYVANSAKLSFPAGTTTQTVNIQVNGDLLNELNETFTVTLANPSNATLGKSSAIGTINNDDATPTLSIADMQVTEGNNGTIDALFNVTLSAASSQTVTVDYTIGGGTAQAGKDYSAKNGSLTFAPETTSQTVSVVVNGDTLNELDETFLVTLTNASNATLPQAAGVGTIQNDDAVPTLSINDVTVIEGDGASVNAVFTLTLSAASGNEVTVDFASADGTARSETTKTRDYVANAGKVTFPAETTTQAISVTVNGDLLNEIDENFTVTLANAVNATLAKALGTATIANNDALPGIDINDVRVTEGDGGTVNATFDVILSAPSGRDISVGFATVDASAKVSTANTKDYVSNSGTLTFPEETTSMQITVVVNGDLLNEIDETFNVLLNNAVNAVITDNSGMCMVTNDDGQPTLTIDDMELLEGNEGTTQFVFTMSLSAPSGREIRVDYATANGTAGTLEPDYTSIRGTSLFAEEMTKQTLTVAVNADTLNEVDETFFINLTNPINVGLVKAQATGTIKNEDAAVVLQLSASSYTVTEGGTATITITRSSNSTGAVTVNYTTNNGSASSGSDYNNASGSVTFANGDSAPKTFTISTIDDNLAEGDENVNIAISSPTGATLSLASATLTINDNDAAQPGQLQFSQSSYTVNEGGGSATITVTRTGGSNVPVTVKYTTADGSAVAGSDYVEVSGMLNFGISVTSQTFTVRVIDNNMIEDEEAVNLTLTDATNGAKLGTSKATLKIEDNDVAQPGQLQFSDAAYSINETGGTITVTVTRTGGNNVPVTIKYATSDGSARAGSDFTTSSGTLNFGVGANSESFTIAINDDNEVEGDETVNLLLSAPTGGATIGNGAAVLTILDNDVPADSPVLQIGSSVDFGTVNIGQGLTRAISVRNSGKGQLILQAPMIAAGAQAGFSVAAPLGSLSLAPGQSTSFSVGFNPTQVIAGGLALNGSVRLTSNGGNAIIALSGVSVDTVQPTVKINSPQGGETFMSGSSITIKFEGKDNDRLNGFVVSYSTDDGASFEREIGRVPATGTEVIWNIPEVLETEAARIRVMTSDRAGNLAMAVSAKFTIKKPVVAVPKPMVKVTVTYDPPPTGRFLPPRNLRVNAQQVKPGTEPIGPRATDDEVPDLLGYNVYRVPAPAPGEPMPTPDEIVGDPKNLVGSVDKDTTSFDETLSTADGGGNFVYSITSFFGGGMQSSGSDTASTELPVIKNLVFKKGTIFFDAAGSFIKQGAVIIVNEVEAFPLQVDTSGAFLTVDKKVKSTPGALTMKKMIKKGATVRLVVKNPDGKVSVTVTFTREK